MTGRAWARTLRDGVHELLADEKPQVGEMEWQPQLMLYRDDAVIHEVKRRGLWPEDGSA